jgi:hypothetical protein
MSQFLHGVLFLGYAVISLFFVRYWRKSHDRLFLFFAVAFAIMSAHRAMLASLDVHNEVGTWVYWVRLLSYVLILYAIVDKNLRQAKS